MAVFKRESRKARHRTKHDAWVTLDGGFAKRGCTILDLSAGGARLQLSDPALAESTLDLAFSKDVRKTTRCRVVWRKGAIVGVEFLTHP